MRLLRSSEARGLGSGGVSILRSEEIRNLRKREMGGLANERMRIFRNKKIRNFRYSKRPLDTSQAAASDRVKSTEASTTKVSAQRQSPQHPKQPIVRNPAYSQHYTPQRTIRTLRRTSGCRDAGSAFIAIDAAPKATELLEAPASPPPRAHYSMSMVRNNTIPPGS